MQVRSLGRKDALEEGRATHSSTLAWRIPWTEEPGGLRAIGSQSETHLKQLSTHARTFFYDMSVQFWCPVLTVFLLCSVDLYIF